VPKEVRATLGILGILGILAALWAIGVLAIALIYLPPRNDRCGSRKAREGQEEGVTGPG